MTSAFTWYSRVKLILDLLDFSSRYYWYNFEIITFFIIKYDYKTQDCLDPPISMEEKTKKSFVERKLIHDII